jgi:hypothetical protein
MLLMAFLMIFNSVFYAGITIATNRTVEASHRAMLNGLSSVGASIGRGFGPLVAGSLIAFSMTSQSIDPTFGSVLAYSVLTAGGMVAFAATYHLSSEEEEMMLIPPTSRMSPNKNNSNGGINIEGINKKLTKNEE